MHFTALVPSSYPFVPFRMQGASECASRTILNFLSHILWCSASCANTLEYIPIMNIPTCLGDEDGSWENIFTATCTRLNMVHHVEDRISMWNVHECLQTHFFNFLSRGSSWELKKWNPVTYWISGLVSFSFEEYTIRVQSAQSNMYFVLYSTNVL